MAFWDYFFKKKSDSATHAVDRIKFVLQSDRTGLPQETLERIKNDIISVLSKYVDIETADLDFNITKAPSESGAMTPALCANIPIKGVKRNTPAAPAKAEAKTDTAKSTSETQKSEEKKDETKKDEGEAKKPESKLVIKEEKTVDENPELGSALDKTFTFKKEPPKEKSVEEKKDTSQK